MWFPHWGYLFWPDGDNSKIQNSTRDNKARVFSVTLFLEELNSRHVLSSTIELAEHYTTAQYFGDKKLDVLFAKKEEGGEENKIANTISKDKPGRLGAIATKVEAKEMIDAVRTAYNAHSQLLSFLSLMNGTNLPIYGIKVVDEKYGAEWHAKPQPHAPDKFALPKGLGFNEHFRVLLSLYREGKNNPSPPYRFLCFYKILEAFYEHRSVFQAADNIICDKNLSFKRPKRKITKDMLLYALCKHPEFEGLSFGTFFEKLRSNQRLQVAHVGKWANLDDFDLFSEFAAVGNLTDLVARQILLDELELWQKFIELGITPA